MTNDETLAKDMFQETVIRFWKGLPGFQGNSKLSTWLYRVTYRVCLDNKSLANQRGRLSSLNEKMENSGFDPADSSSSGQRIEKNVSDRDSVNRALEKIKPEWRAMLILFYWRGLSLEEVAEITGRPLNTVKVYLHRARGELREILKDGGFSIAS